MKVLRQEKHTQVYNINQGHNAEILKKCEVLDNYSFFIDKVRKYQKEGFSLDEALLKAVQYCIENNRLKDFLETHSSEVNNMLLTQKYDPQEEMEALKEEAWEYGYEDGIERGIEKGIEKGIERGIEREKIATARNALAQGIPAETIQKITGLDMAVIEQLAVGDGG